MASITVPIVTALWSGDNFFNSHLHRGFSPVIELFLGVSLNVSNGLEWFQNGRTQKNR